MSSWCLCITLCRYFGQCRASFFAVMRALNMLSRSYRGHDIKMLPKSNTSPCCNPVDGSTTSVCRSLHVQPHVVQPSLHIGQAILLTGILALRTCRCADVCKAEQSIATCCMDCKYVHCNQRDRQSKHSVLSKALAKRADLQPPQRYMSGFMRTDHECCDPGKSMYESDDIVKHLFSNYGDGQVPWGLSLGLFTTLSCGLALLPR